MSQPSFDAHDGEGDFSDEEFEDDDGPGVESRQATALYDFPGTNDGELKLSAGEVFDVIEDDDESSGWIQVRNTSGQEGYAPASYLKVTTSV